MENKRIEKSKIFIHEFNKNKVTKEFLESCKIAGRLFKKGEMSCECERKMERNKRHKWTV